MYRISALSLLTVLLTWPVSNGLAQSPAGASTASAPDAVHSAASGPLTPGVPEPRAPAASPGTCEREIAGARIGAPSDIVIQLDPDTLWRPRGTEVRFTISGSSGSPPHVRRVLACFRWSMAYAVPKVGDLGYTPSPLVRSVPNTDGLIEYGALVPSLPGADRFGMGPTHQGAVEYMAVYTVPVADMQILVELDNGWVAVVLPVGITNVPTALAVLLVCLVLALTALWRWAPTTMFGGVARGPLDAISRHTLAVICAPDGMASLSQFQIMLWAFVVGGAATYVMVLSGNLISISTGTLTLLGIAGGTSILARVPPPKRDGQPKTTPASGPPRWRQLLLSNDDADATGVDVTRVQMLIFTLVTAAFVAVKVAVSYGIPEIPDNFLLLMGISNGVYIAGRQIPDRGKGNT